MDRAPRSAIAVLRSGCNTSTHCEQKRLKRKPPVTRCVFTFAVATKEAFMTHRNAPLTPEGRRRLVDAVIIDGWSARRAAERFAEAIWQRCTERSKESIPPPGSFRRIPYESAKRIAREQNRKASRLPPITLPVRLEPLVLHFEAETGSIAWGQPAVPGPGHTRKPPSLF